jgi:hypothetical protein
MAKMSKAQAKKRLNEARSKIKAVYMSYGWQTTEYVKTQDMAAIEKILDKCLKRLG